MNCRSMPIEDMSCWTYNVLDVCDLATPIMNILYVLQVTSSHRREDDRERCAGGAERPAAVLLQLGRQGAAPPLGGVRGRGARPALQRHLRRCAHLSGGKAFKVKLSFMALGLVNFGTSKVSASTFLKAQ